MKASKLVILATVVVLLSPIAVFAQEFTTPTDEGFQSNENEALFGGNVDHFNPVDLINRSNLSGDDNSDEFSEADQQPELDGSATDFKKLQQERILNQQ